MMPRARRHRAGVESVAFATVLPKVNTEPTYFRFTSSLNLPTVSNLGDCAEAGHGISKFPCFFLERVSSLGLRVERLVK
jgi:hypothetical protein